MAAKKLPGPPPGRSLTEEILSMNRPLPPGSNLADAIETHLKTARTFDPEHPLRNNMLRKIACGWLANHGVDLAAVGLPLEIDLELDRKAQAGQSLPMIEPSPPPDKGFKNAEAEEGVVAALMNFPDSAAAIFKIVQPEDFGYPQYRYMVRAVKDLIDAGSPHDAGHVIQELGATARLDAAYGPDTVGLIASKPVTADQALALAALVRKNAEQRTMGRVADNLKRGLVSGEKTLEEVVAGARELLDRVGVRPEADNPLDGFRRWPAAPDKAVWHGPAGELVAMVEPHTEADPIAVLTQFLACFGSMIGRRAHWTVGGTKHFCNLYVLVAGHTGEGRKGTAKDVVDILLEGMTETWANECRFRGLASGEGFIEVIRDPSRQGKQFHPGSENKTAFWMEPEFGTTLELMNRDGNSLMGKLRDAWDGIDLVSATKGDPMRATSPYVTLCAHITFSDFHRYLSNNAMLNGFANRFLVVCSRRTRDLAHGADLRVLEWKPLRKSIIQAIRFGSDASLASSGVPFDAKAYDLWTSIYPELMRLRSEAVAPMCQRAAPMVRRMAVIYAVLDRSKVVGEAHLLAGLELWRYAERSLNFILGGDKPKEDDDEKIFAAIRASAENGIGRNEINRTLFGGRKKEAVSATLQTLLRRGVIDEEIVMRVNAKTPLYFKAGMSPAARSRARSVFTSATTCPVES